MKRTLIATTVILFFAMVGFGQSAPTYTVDIQENKVVLKEEVKASENVAPISSIEVNKSIAALDKEMAALAERRNFLLSLLEKVQEAEKVLAEMPAVAADPDPKK